jgi:hypothetical protein
MYREITLSLEPFRIGHMCIYIYIYFLVRMTNTMTSPNIDLFSWDILHVGLLGVSN